MKNVTHLVISLILLLCAAGGVYCFDKQIVLGREDGWQDFVQVTNLVLKPGRWGTQDYFLKDNEYIPTPDTDLLLHFNQNPLRDESGNYRVLREDILLSERIHTYGKASGGFTSTKKGISLFPGEGALFRRGTWWEDFSIEFWLYPLLLSDGEVIFSWVGSRWEGDRIIPQRISCIVERRKLIWDFESFFVPPEDERLIDLHGITPLIPRVWHHHLVRYSSSNGLLEYIVDGIPEALAYSTDSGKEQGNLSTPYVGGAGAGPLSIGENFTGFMDEFRISRNFEESPALTRYNSRTGVARSRIFDFGYTGTELKRIDSVYRKPADSEVYFFYRISDYLGSRNQLNSTWKQFIPGREIENARGRYFQLMFELFPDGPLASSPEISELRIIYEQDLPPAPPPAVHAVPGDGQVQLYWKKVNEYDVRGYRIYYGDTPGNYHGTDSNLGDSPIDVGDVSSFKITGLKNGKLYYFSITAYDSTEPPHQSLFSKEISARPFRLLQ